MTDPNVWSPTDASNNDAPPAGWPEGMLPSGVNDAARAMMGGLRRWYERANWALVTGGTANALSLAYPVPTVTLDGDVFFVVPEQPNTGPTTLDVGGGSGPLPIYQGEAPLRGGELQKRVPVLIAYSQLTGRFQMVHAPVELPLIGSLGAPNAQTLTYTTGAPTALVYGDRFTFYPLVGTNTGPVTLNVQGLGAYNVLAGGLPCAGGELLQYVIVDVVWDGTNFQLVNAIAPSTYLRLAGGTLTGPISAPQYNISGVIFASHFGADGTVIYDGAGTAKIITTGAAGSNDNFYRATVHEFSDAAGTGNFAAIDNTGLAVTGAITASSNITATGNLSGGGLLLSGVPFAAHPAAGVNTIYDGDGGDCISLFGAASGYANYYRGDTHSFQNNANTLTALQLTTANANFSGNVIAGGQVTGSFIGSTGNINCASFMNAGTYNMAGVALADQVGTVRSLYDSSPLACIRWFTTGENSYDNSTHTFRSRGALATWAIFNAGGTYNVSGSWLTISDVSIKENIEPYSRGLAALKQLQPVSYRYAAGTPFADEAGTTRYGLVAQDVETVVPEMVGEATFGDERVSTLDPGHLLWMLLNGCKEMASRIEALEAQISAHTEGEP